MTWLLTHGGNVLDIEHIDPNQIDLGDISRSLSLTYRFNGMTRRPISVAEHSLNVVDIMERTMGISNPGALLAGLMHDAHEFITGDLPSPMKAVVGDAWRNTETHVQRQVLKRFGLWTEYITHRHEIGHADMTALSTERAQLLPQHERAWPCMNSHPPVEWIKFSLFDEWQPIQWQAAFLLRFDELSKAHDQAKNLIAAAGMVA